MAGNTPCTPWAFADFQTWQEQMEATAISRANCPERQLAFAVIRTGFIDAKRLDMHEELEDWLASEDFEDWCEAAELAPVFIARKLKEAMEGALTGKNKNQFYKWKGRA